MFARAADLACGGAIGYALRMDHEPDIFDRHDPAAEAAAIASARADAAAGRIYDHGLVGPWLKTLGSPDYKPFWEWLADRNG